jgi:ubiquitin-protein ligase
MPAPEAAGLPVRCPKCGFDLDIPTVVMPRPRLPVRTRRLLADAEQMRQTFAGSSLIRVFPEAGDPPERYRVEYHVRGLAPGPDGKPVSRDQHVVEIQLTSEYPRAAPKCKVLTPIFHPNIDPTTVCVGDHWAAGERLADLVVRIGEMIAYQAYNIKSPLDGEAAMWADLNQKRLPIDTRDLRAEEASPVLEALPATAIAARRVDRHTAPRAVTKDLEPVLRGRPVSAGPGPRPPKPAGWVSRHRALVSGVVASLLVGLVSWLVASRLLALANDRLAAERNKVKQADREVQAKSEQLAQARDAADKAAQRAREAEQRAQMAANAEMQARQAVAQARLAETQARHAEAQLRQAELAKRKQAEEVASLLELVFHKVNPRTQQTESALKQQIVTKLDTIAALLDRVYADQPVVHAQMCDALGRALWGMGEAKKAVGIHERALALRQRHLPPNDPRRLSSMNNLAIAYQADGQLDRAVALFEQSLGGWRRTRGPTDQDTLITMGNLAHAYTAREQVERAVPLFEEALAAYRKWNPDHAQTLVAMNSLAGAYQAAGQLDKASALHQETLAKRQAKRGPDHPETLQSMNNLAATYQADGQLEKAVPLFEETLAKRQAQRGSEHPDTLQSMNNLALAYLAAKQPAKAKPLLDTFLAKEEKRLGGASTRLAGYQATAALALLNADQAAAAEPLARACLAIRVRNMPDDWLTFNARSLLGGVLLARKKYAEAEPLLVQGHEGLKQRQAKLPRAARLRPAEALERLVKLYEATGRDEEAACYRKELEAVKQRPKE